MTGQGFLGLSRALEAFWNRGQPERNWGGGLSPAPPGLLHPRPCSAICSRVLSSSSASFRAWGPGLGRCHRWGPRWPLWTCSCPSGVRRQMAPSAGFSRCPDTRPLCRRRQTKEERGRCYCSGARRQVPTNSQECGSVAAGWGGRPRQGSRALPAPSASRHPWCGWEGHVRSGGGRGFHPHWLCEPHPLSTSAPHPVHRVLWLGGSAVRPSRA